MLSIQRRPLSARSHPLRNAMSVNSPAKPALGAATNFVKRPRTPEDDQYPQPPTKRPRPDIPLTQRLLKDVKPKRTKEVREREKMEFKAQYSRAFPSWKFYFDGVPSTTRDLLSRRILSLGATIDEFFSRDITHFITNRPRPPPDPSDAANKENMQPKSLKGAGILRSPIKLKTRVDGFDPLSQAIQYGIKIWDIAKLDSVLSRVIGVEVSAPSRCKPSLNHLLTTERLHNTTLERDQKAKRHDYEYFQKNSYFLLVEDIAGEFCPIAIREYARPRPDEEPEWPTLHADSRARNPFAPYDDREAQHERKRERREDKEIRDKQAILKKLRTMKQRELRRSASLNNLDRKRQASMVVEDPSGLAVNSIPIASGYLAASGNSVVITSNTASTSLSTNSTGLFRNCLKVLPALGKHTQQVITNRTFGSNKKPLMPPPGMKMTLRKSKSTNTIRLPTREETRKPGYCECCKLKFEDFSHHIKGSKHRRFARNPSNFSALDDIIKRVARKTVRQAQASSDWAVQLTE